MLALTGRYADQIERYLEVFPKERFLFLDFRDLTRDPQAVLTRTCEFLEIDAPVVAPEEMRERRNVNYQMTLAGYVFETCKSMVPGLQRNLRRVLPSGAQRVLIDKVLRRPSPLEFYDEDQARGLFEDDLARVEALTGLKL